MPEKRNLRFTIPVRLLVCPMKQLVSGSMVYHGNDGVKTENRLYVKKLLLALKNTKTYTRWSSHLEDNLDGDPCCKHRMYETVSSKLFT